MTSATYQTTINVDMPDNPYGRLLFTLETDRATAGDEIIPHQRTYRLALDADGVGNIDLPTPDNTGVASWSWYVRLPSGGPYLITVAYDAAAQELADLLAA